MLRQPRVLPTPARLARFFAVFAVSIGAFPLTPGAQTLPAQPRVFLDTAYPVTRVSVQVAGGGDLQGALDRAQPGDTILLDPGATYVGPFTLPNKGGSEWIVIRTAAADSRLPAQGQRITPGYASALPKILAPSGSPAIRTAAGAHHYRFTGVEIALESGVSRSYGLVQIGEASSAQTRADQAPHNIVFDRVYVHGRSDAHLRRGIALNSGWAAVIDSYISEIHEGGADSQAIAGWNGPGPFKIVNNYLEAAGENVLFGGADPSIPNLVPSDLEIRGNHFSKPTSWRGGAWSVKNLFELKNARRVLIDGNVFEYNWPNGQNGFAILFTVRNQDGTAPWSVVEDVTFTNNVVRHVANGVNILGNDNLHPSGRTRRVLIKNNLFDDVGGSWGGQGRLFQVLEGAVDVTVDHNTGLQSGDVIVATGEANQNFVYRSNLAPHNTYGVAGDGTFGDPSLTLSRYFPQVVFSRNILAGGNASRYPSDNYLPPSLADVQFVNQAQGNYRLRDSSPYRRGGTDGQDVGIDVDALNRATGGAVGGGSPPPPPSGPSDSTDRTAPSVTITSPAANATVSGVLRVTASASDDRAVSSVTFGVDNGPTVEDAAAPFEATWDTRNFTDGAHAIAAVARDAAGNAASAAVTVTVSNGQGAPPAPSAGAQPVAWTNLANVTANGNSLQKTSGCDGCPDAGAVSAQSVGEGGYVEFTVTSTLGQRAIGLNATSADNGVVDLDFALRLWPGGGIDVREGGQYRTETQSAVGDVFRIAIEGGIVSYAKNGTVFYRSTAAPSPSLLVDTALLSLSSTVSNVMVGSGGAAGDDNPPTGGGQTSPEASSSSPDGAGEGSANCGAGGIWKELLEKLGVPCSAR